ncbi:MAG TPA: 4-vinyl reductase [Caldisericia bacterium]|jgi:hypothetical protein|nr:MAG: V4R domain protein [bacterium ADurb.Bin132]HNW31514.1 4-vinyl reductase [Caldisericia bacterium]HNY60692.1 4-vinyl reductase [Caldisericia bacterium]HOG69982.1 4-vinyl reductase [Caldisericia bacterium]HPA64950.1 4-vinyl reductase [Caldisericia bacterium]
MTIDQAGIRKTVLDLGLFGDEKTGILRRFDIMLSAFPTAFYVYRELALVKAMGGEPSRKLAEKVLIDAAQWSANQIFSGVMASPEWKSLIEPKIQNMQDRLQGMIAITNCLGWGFVTDCKLDESAKTLQLTVKNSYYIDAYKNRYGKNSDYPICYMWTGTAGGYMDLLFGQKPNTFVATETTCAAKSGDICVFEAKISKTKFGFN